jgi:hypothetical protein
MGRFNSMKYERGKYCRKWNIVAAERTEILGAEEVAGKWSWRKDLVKIKFAEDPNRKYCTNCRA